MADADPVTLGKINYYCREKFYRSMQNAAVEGLRKYGNDPVLKFFNAYSYVLEGRVQEGMRELELLKDKRDVNLCSIMALIQGHKLSRTVDREAVQELDAKLKEERKQAGEKGLYFAGLFLFHNNRIDKAREYIDRLLKMNNSSSEGLVIKGWIDLLSGRESYMKKAIKYFDEALSQDQNKDPDALFGKAKYFEMRRNYSGALELINQVVVSFPNFLPALIEKIKVQLALQDWDQVSETCQRALIVDSNCLEALRYQLLHIICRDGNYAEAASFLGELLETMDRAEPKNGQLYSDMASVFARVAGRNALVLQQTYYLAERAVSLDGGNAEFVNELGYQLMLQGRNKDAMKCYRNAMKLDETSVSALTGIIRCQLLEDQLEDAAQQLEFLNEIQQSIGRTAELSYLSAILAKKRNKEPSAVISLLNEAIESHFEELKGTPLGVDYFVKINPDFLVQIINDYLSYAPQQPGQTGQPVHPVLKKCSQVLDPLTRSVPGLLEGVYLMGKVKYLAGDIDAAQSTLQHCLDQDSTFSDAHILMAQIHLNQGNFKMANQSLEVGLSYNFEVREHPIYHLIKARIAKKQGNYEEAVKTLQVAMGLPGIKSGRSSSAKKSKAKNMISVNDRVSVFLELADAHRQLGEQHEATKVMQDAINEFQGTPEEVRIAIANSEFSLNRGDIEGALQQLRNIGPDQPYFVQAREKMADIYLHHRKDKRLYAGCYRELAEKYPSPHTQLLLGDAYINIQEPEKAIEVYEGALKKNPKDGNLASKIGKALVKTHNYGKAMNYYEAALRSGGQSFLRYDLAELLLRLRQFEKAEKVLRQALDTDAGTDLESMMDQAKYMVLLSKVHHKTDRLDDSLLALTKAREMQARVLKRVQVEQPDAITAQKQLAASICSQMAEHSSAQRDYEKAIKFYKEALIYNESDGKLGLELAHLYLITEDLDSCQHQLMTLLKNDKENDAATVMMADLMFRKNDYDSAMFHFQQLLERKPDHYQAMSRLIDLMRRAGKLDEVPKFFQMAEEASTKTAYDSGYHYCKGLYEWYCGNPNNALKSFNKARRDVDLGQEALCNMIDICLNPDNDTIGGEVFESVDPDAGGAKAEGEQLAVRTAEKLLKELKPKPGDIRPRLLDNMMLIATKSKSNIEKALSSFMEVASTEKDHVGALYGMAAAYMVLKQTPRARNQLKRVAKNTWNMQDAEDLEKSWLLLADIYIQSGKFDIATDLLKRILQYNKSCCKAYEYMGFIMEKEQSYKDAARYYENAWKYGNKNNPNIGYKLAFNYLKARRFVDAIDICHLVLTGHPNYPKIKKDILDKSRANLRA